MGFGGRRLSECSKTIEHSAHQEFSRQSLQYDNCGSLVTKENFPGHQDAKQSGNCIFLLRMAIGSSRLIVVAVVLALGSVVVGKQIKLRVDTDAMIVSGIGSGADFAVQFHLANR